MPSCFDHLYGHPQATRVHKIKITVENIIFCLNEMYSVYRYNSGIV
jgi:hypothetical protein